LTQALVYCTLELVALEPSLAAAAMRGVIKAWPTAWEANSMKEIMLLGEMEQLLEKSAAVSLKHAGATLALATPALVRAAAGPNARVGERALRLVLGPSLPVVVKSAAAQSARFVSDFLPAVVQGGGTHWSTTMNTLRGGSTFYYLFKRSLSFSKVPRIL
jgi:hypothetical protein